jgi:hypothetical protein
MMSTPDIKAFFRLAHQHFDALEALFNTRKGGLRETELRSLLDDGSPHTASAGHVFRELQSHRLIEPRPEETASFELTPSVRDLFREFRRKQKLSTPEAIQAYLDRLEELMERLEDRVGQSGRAGVERVLEDIDTEIEKIRTLSRSKREAVLNRVTELRAETRSDSVRERFRMINELLEDYVTPLKNIVQNRGAFETLFSDLRTALSEAQTTFSDDPSMARAFTSTKARLQRVRRSVLENFEAARQETTRLYEQHETNSEILKGASSLLNRVHHEDAGALDLTGEMKLASFTMRTVFQDEGLSSYLHKMSGYEPPDPDPIQEPSSSGAPLVIDRETLIADARRACPIPDAMSWLVGALDGSEPRRTLRAYRYLLQSPQLSATFRDERKEYDLGDVLLSATPVHVTVKERDSSS